MIDRPAKAEAGAAERAGLAAHLAAHRLGDTVDNRQAEAAASCRPVPAGVKADKGLKHPLALLGGDSRAVILNQQRCARTLQRQADRHPLAAVAQGVVDQIIQHPLHQSHIQRAVVTVGQRRQGDLALWVNHLDILDVIADPGGKIGSRQAELRLRAVEAGVGQELFNQRLQLTDIAVQRLRFRLAEIHPRFHLQTGSAGVPAVS